MFISYFLIISKEFTQSGSPWICYKNLLKVPETSSSDNNWSTSKRTKRNKLPLFKRCKLFCRYNIHYPSAHWNKNVRKNLYFLNSPFSLVIPVKKNEENDFSMELFASSKSRERDRSEGFYRIMSIFGAAFDATSRPFLSALVLLWSKQCFGFA